MGRLVVIGSVNTDMVITSAELPKPGATVLGGEFARVAGGKGANQAVAAARAGTVKVTFLAAVGDDDLGRAAQDILQRETLDASWIKVVAGRSSGVALIMVDQHGQNCISVAPGANLELFPEDVDRAAPQILQGDGVLLASLESPLKTVHHALSLARARGWRTILNPAPADKTIANRDWLSLVDVLTPNESEAETLSGIAVEDEQSAIEAAHVLRSRGCPIVIVTRGAQGCVVVAEETQVVPAPRVNAVDATAAGDAFNGSLAAELAAGRKLLDAVRWAAAVASFSVTRHGAQPSLPTRAEVVSFVAGISGK